MLALHFSCHFYLGEFPVSTLDITLTPEEFAELSRRVRSATISQRDGPRARINLLSTQGSTREEFVRLTGFSRPLPDDTIRCGLEQFTQPRIGEPHWSCRNMGRTTGKF